MSIRIASIPEDVEVVVIGDVHGRADLLKASIEHFEMGDEFVREEKLAFVFLGDLIDRGPQSHEAIELALEAVGRHPGSAIVMGNHEEFMLDVMWGSDQWNAWDCWYTEGGAETLRSMGLDAGRRGAIEEIILSLRRDELVRRLFEVCVDAACDSRRIYSHAGIEPHVALEEQKPFHLRWIRGEFLDSRADHGRIVVHGHSTTRYDLPEVRPNRIAVDTGAYRSGKLTAAWFSPDGSSGFVMAQGAPREGEPCPIRTGPVDPVEGA